MLERLQTIDSMILMGLRSAFSAPWLDKPMLFLTALGDHGLLWTALTILFFFMGGKNNRWRERGMLLFLSLGINAVFCNVLLKPVVGRMRPYDLLEYEIFVQRLSDSSFPSGHTSAAFAAATGLYFMNKKWGIGAYIFAVCMGFSRLYLGVHFPTDVLAGAFLGWLAGKLAIFIYKKMHFVKKKSSVLK